MIKIKQIIGALQDLLFIGDKDVSKAVEPVYQKRGDKQVAVNKINIDTIPAHSKFGADDFISIRQYIKDEINQAFLNKSIPIWDDNRTYPPNYIVSYDYNLYLSLKTVEGGYNPKQFSDYWLKLTNKRYKPAKKLEV